MESGYLPYGNWFFKKCCPHRSQVSTYSHGQNQVLWSQLCPCRLCLWTLPALHQAKESPAVPGVPSSARLPIAPPSTASSSGSSHLCSSLTLWHKSHRTTHCFGRWQPPSLLLLPHLCSHLRGLGEMATELARFAVADQREKGHGNEIHGQELMS